MSGAKINREQAGWLAFHNGRDLSENDYSPGSLSISEFESGWHLARSGYRFCDLEHASHLRVTCDEQLPA